MSKTDIFNEICKFLLLIYMVVFGFLLGSECKEQENMASIKEIQRLREELACVLEEKEQMEIEFQEKLRELLEEKEKEEEVVVEEKEEVKGCGDFKSYMDFRAITNRESKSYNIVTNGWTDEDGLRRFGECYCVALGSYYGEVGDVFLVTMTDGKKFKVVKADEKSDRHTDPEHKYTLSNGCMLEFVVETDKLDKKIKSSGNINNLEKVSGTIYSITKITETEEE